MGISIKGLDHIQICIPVGEENTARSFYLDLLQFEEVEKPEALKKNGGFWCRAGRVNLHIGVETFEKTISKRHPAFLVDDIHGARNILRKHNVSIKEETPIPGVDRFSFYDPFMNRIEFLQKTSTDLH